MKISEVLRKAARSLERGTSDCCCAAIRHVAGLSETWYDHNLINFRIAKLPPTQKFFAIYFRPRNSNGFWFGPRYVGDGRDRRILALCLAAAIAESEGN